MYRCNIIVVCTEMIKGMYGTDSISLSEFWIRCYKMGPESFERIWQMDGDTVKMGLNWHNWTNLNGSKVGYSLRGFVRSD